jgi:hypothetical protein
MVAVAWQVFSVGNIIRCAHIIRQITSSHRIGDGGKERWLVNNHIDLATSNHVYSLEREKCILRAGRRNARIDFGSDTNSIAIPMQAHTQ